MAIDFNEVFEVAHGAGKPFIMQGLEVALKKADDMVAESGTIVDNLLWADVKEAFKAHEDVNPT